jgi:TATA-box binding protein (TBP) (component of TFIID and TFIIIB)
MKGKGAAVSVTPLRISTMTMTGTLGSPVDLNCLFWAMPLVHTDHTERAGVVRIERIQKATRELHIRHADPEDRALVSINERRPGVPFTCFDNQLTVVFRCRQGEGLNLISVKVFRNGNVQMTGVRYLSQVLGPLGDICGVLRRLADRAGAPHTHSPQNLRVHMINCDCRASFQVNREALYDTLCTKYRGLPCSYEPCIYPGVKVYDSYHHEKTGVKHKTTISVFQSGCIIITGSCSYRQMQEARELILRILAEERGKVAKVHPRSPSLVLGAQVGVERPQLRANAGKDAGQALVVVDEKLAEDEGHVHVAVGLCGV